jgi:hypothetical protein
LKADWLVQLAQCRKIARP